LLTKWLIKVSVFYSICLYIGKETYESLETAANLFTLELIGLNEDGFTDKQGNNWPVELFFSADWKFLALTMGVKSAIANNSCLYCECHKNQRYDMERTWINSRNKTGLYHTICYHFVIFLYLID